jgi:hypothetical protein
VVPLALAAGCILGAVGTLAYLLAASGVAYSHYGWAAVQALGRTPAYIFWIFVAGGLAFGIFGLANSMLAVAVFEDGLAFRSLSGSRNWGWDEVAALYVAVTREAGPFSRTRHRFTLEHNSGKKTAFDDRLEDVLTLGAMLGRKILERVYPAAAERFNAGETVDFGFVRIRQAGIELRERTSPWTEVEYVSVRRGYFQIQPRNAAPFGLPVATIPNLDVLLLLLDHLTDLRLEE